jgi:hypothetical protein
MCEKLWTLPFGTPQLKWVHAGIAMTKWQLRCFLPALARSFADRVEFVINYRGSKDRDENGS